MTLIYCLKCRKKTETSDEEAVYTVKNHPQLTGLCDICGRVKFVFTDKDFKVRTRVKNTAKAKEKRDRAAIKRKAKKLGFHISDIEKI